MIRRLTIQQLLTWDGKQWTKCDVSGEFSNIMHNPVCTLAETICTLFEIGATDRNQWKTIGYRRRDRYSDRIIIVVCI